jgi:hypothetical protein
MEHFKYSVSWFKAKFDWLVFELSPLCRIRNARMPLSPISKECVSSSKSLVESHKAETLLAG